MFLTRSVQAVCGAAMVTKSDGANPSTYGVGISLWGESGLKRAVSRAVAAGVTGQRAPS